MVFCLAGSAFKGSTQPQTAEWIGIVFFGAQFVLILGCTIATITRKDVTLFLAIVLAALGSIGCFVVAFFAAMAGTMVLANTYL